MVAALTSAVSSPALANNCGDSSALLDTLGDAYGSANHSAEYVAQNTELDNHDLIELFATLKLSTGKGVRYRCMGTGDAERVVSTAFTLEDIVKVETARGTVQIKAWEESEKKMSSAVFDIPKEIQWQSSSKGVYSSSQVFRRANKRGLAAYPQNATYFPLHRVDINTTQRLELARTIQTNQDSIILTEALYLNGLKTDWVTWQLDR